MIRDAFNWLAGKPSQQFVLDEKNAFQMNRAGRIVERFTSIPPMVVGALAMVVSVPTALFAPPVGVALFAGGAATAAFGKVAGLVKGGLTHLVAKGASSLVNYLTRDKQPKTAAPAPQPQ